MNPETFHDALSLLPMDLIAETEARRRRPRIRPWVRPAAAAACVAIALTAFLAVPRQKTAQPIPEQAACDVPMAAAPAEIGTTQYETEEYVTRSLDAAAQFPGAFTPDGYTVLDHQAGAGDSAVFSKIFPDVPSLDAEAENILVGAVTDIVYTDDDAAPRTILTFRVSEVLKGEIPPNSLISVAQSGGYVRMKTFVDVYGTDHFPEITQEEIDTTLIRQSLMGAPLPEVGEEYVLFLSPRRTEGRLAGAYVIIGNFMGRYALDEDTGLYDRYRPEDIEFTDGPMTLDEVKDQLRQ